jgi:hypothetical protein
MSRFTTIACLLILTPFSQAATHYVYSGSTGAGTGADWNNAYTALPSSLTRGDIYVVAGGKYGSHTFADVESSSTRITIRKASSAASYRDDLVAGWSPTYESTQAVFAGSWIFTRSYYTIDGVTPGTNWPTSGLGIKVVTNTNPSYPIQIGAQVRAASYNTFRNIEIATQGPSSDVEQFGVYELDNYASVNNTWSYCYFHGSENAVHSAGGGGISGWTFEHSYFDTNWSSSAHHGEQFAIWYGSSNHVIRYNYFNSYQGTGAIMAGGDGATESNIQIYGNVFYNMGMNNGAGGAVNGTFGTMDSSGTSNLTNWKIYNNTFVNGDVRLSSPSGGSATGWVVENNLFYNASTDIMNIAPRGTYDYNYYNSGSWGWSAGGNDQHSSANPFVNLSGGDYHLAAATTTGVTLPSPYNIDPDGVTRASGNWDRGAYEYGKTAGISPPSNLNASVN